MGCCLHLSWHLSFVPDQSIRWCVIALALNFFRFEVQCRNTIRTQIDAGMVNARTHLSDRVVNRVSHFQKSAGLDEIDPNAAQLLLDDARPLSPTSAVADGSAGSYVNHRRPLSSSSDAYSTPSNNSKSSSAAGSLSSDPRGATVPLVIEPMAQIKHGDGLVPAAARAAAAVPGVVSGAGGLGSSGRKHTNAHAIGGSTESVVSISVFFSCKRIKPLASPQLLDRRGSYLQCIVLKVILCRIYLLYAV